MNDYPLISVIVPVYKVEPYLRKCVDSIIAQTYSNLEIILVDDGSPDDCWKICDEYAEKDNRVRVVHKENGGLSDARNAGLDIAKGSYITFIDSDDFVTPNYVEYLYELIISHGAEISGCDYLPVREDGVAIRRKNIFINNKLYNKEDFKEMFSIMLYNENLYDSAWAKLYKKDIFVDTRFPKGKLFEDYRTTPQLLHKAKRVIFGKEKYYFYCIRQNSISTQNYSDRILDVIDATKEMCHFINGNYKGLEKACARRNAVAHIRVLRWLVESDNFNKKEAGLLRKKILKGGRSLIFDGKTPKRDRFAVFSLLFGIRVFFICWNVYAKFTNRK